MNQEAKFVNYLRTISNESNKVIVESILQGFKVLSNYSEPLNESIEDGAVDGDEQDTADSSNLSDQPSDGIMTESDETPIETTEEIKPEEPDEVVASEVVAPELLEKVKKLCTEVLGLYKHMTGTEFIKEDENETDEISDSSTESGEVNGDDSIPTPMLEEINLGARQASSDYTNTDYSKAFNQVFSTMDMTEQSAEAIYKSNNVDSQDQIIKNTIPLIDKILNTYMTEFEHMEAEHMDTYIEVIRSNIAQAVSTWIHTLRALEVSVNQQHSLKGLYGRHVVGKFIEDVYQPATNYTQMITDLFKTGDVKLNGDKLVANLKAITDKISGLVTKFKADVQGNISTQAGGKAYTKTNSTPQQSVPA